MLVSIIRLCRTCIQRGIYIILLSVSFFGLLNFRERAKYPAEWWSRNDAQYLIEFTLTFHLHSHHLVPITKQTVIVVFINMYRQFKNECACSSVQLLHSMDLTTFLCIIFWKVSVLVIVQKQGHVPSNRPRCEVFQNNDPKFSVLKRCKKLRFGPFWPEFGVVETTSLLLPTYQLPHHHLIKFWQLCNWSHYNC